MRDTKASSARRFVRTRGFTLVEVLISVALASMVMAGVIECFLLLTRSGVRLYNYSVMQGDSRRMLESFSEDVRMATDVRWNSDTSESSSVTLTVPDNYAANSNTVTYAWDSSTSGATSFCFYRMPGDAASVAAKTILVRDVASCAYHRFDRNPLSPGEADSDSATKCINLTMVIRRTAVTTVDATETSISATYLIRNKPTN